MQVPGVTVNSTEVLDNGRDVFSVRGSGKDTKGRNITLYWYKVMRNQEELTSYLSYNDERGEKLPVPAHGRVEIF